MAMFQLCNCSEFLDLIGVFMPFICKAVSVPKEHLNLVLHGLVQIIEKKKYVFLTVTGRRNIM